MVLKPFLSRGEGSREHDPLKTDPGICGCNTQDFDTDMDGVMDCKDGCPEDPNKVALGICGCGVADADSDGDGSGDACDPVYATVDIDPDSLNLKSKSDKNAITAYMELPVEAEVSQIDINNVALDIKGSIIAAQIKPSSIGDHDNDGITDIMVKFERQAVINALVDTELSFWGTISRFFGWKVDINLVVNGYLHDGRHFTGEDTIKVILPGK